MLDYSLLSKPKKGSDISLSGLEVILEMFAFIILVGNWIYCLIELNILPDEMPMISDSETEGPEYVSKYFLLILSLMMTIVYVIFTMIGRFPEKLKYSVEITYWNVTIQYRMIRIFYDVIKLLIEFMFSDTVFETARVAKEQIQFNYLFINNNITNKIQELTKLYFLN